MEKPDSLLLAPARIRIETNGCAYSEQFDDIYYRDDGIDEVTRTFVDPGNVIAAGGTYPRVSVAELGFGTGLNFVVTASALLERSKARLHFISVEQFPLDHQHWQTLATQRAARLPLYLELARKAPPRLPGWHRRMFAEGRVVLSVFHGDAEAALTDLNARQRNTIDTWYLDGFAPNRNPKMWTPELFRLVAERSHEGTRLATFTAASRVRRGLNDAGFATQMIDQRPFKRESLAGTYTGKRARVQLAPSEVTVHGAGLGGTNIARQLADLGVRSVLRDPRGIANGASGIPTTLLHARLLGDHSVTAEHRVSAYHHACAALERHSGVSHTGALQLCGPNLSADKLKRVATRYGADEPTQHHWIEKLTPTELRARGLPNEAGEGLWFAGARLIRTQALCRALSDHANIKFSRDVGSTRDGTAHVLCSGMAARSATPYDWLELAQVHGQVDSYWQPKTRCQVPVVGHGYYLPQGNSCIVGATYEYRPWQTANATQQNRENNAAYLHENSRWDARFRAARTVSSDRLPVVGKLEPSVWIATAFGSMGTSAAPLAAAQIASELLGWIPPVSVALEQALSPKRFVERQERRGKLRNWS